MMTSMENIKLILSYEGTHYLGYQHTKEGPSIEGYLKEILEKILQQKIQLQVASRTDAGVHAKGQVANFFLKPPRCLKQLLKSLNQLLPKDIRICSLEKVPSSFHATLDAKQKEYHYCIDTSSIQLPFNRFFSWHYPFPLNLEKMKTAAAYFLGNHDFCSFYNEPRSQLKKTFCTLYKCDLIYEKNYIYFIICGNRFLYKMVRTLVGTLIFVGSEKLSLEEAQALLAKKDRSLAGITAPAHGLTLKKVFYNSFCEKSKGYKVS